MDLDKEYNSIIEDIEERLEYIQSCGIYDIPASSAAVSKGSGIPPDNRALGALKDEADACTACGLYKERKGVALFGSGNPRPVVLVAGSAPSKEDEASGEPFSGAAGELLTKILSSMGLKREEVYLCHAVKCPSSGHPGQDEVSACRHFIEGQIATLEPRMIITLGQTAALALLDDADVDRLRGRFHMYGDIKVMPTYDLKKLMEEPDLKKKTWEDMKMVMKELKS